MHMFLATPRPTRWILITVVLAAILGGVSTSPAQSLWLEPQTGQGVSLEILKPGFKNVEFTTFTRTWYVTGRFAASDNASIVVEVPYAHYAIKDRDESEQAFGNIYVGGEIGPRVSGFRFDFGIRIPTAPADNDALITGAYSDSVDRIEAFYPEIFSGVVAARYRYLSEGGFGLDFRLAPAIWFDMSGDASDATETFLRTSVQARYEMEQIAVGGGYSNRILLSDDESLQDRTVEQLVFFANLRFGAWRPGLQVRVPLDDDLTRRLDTTAALSIGYDF